MLTGALNRQKKRCAKKQFCARVRLKSSCKTLAETTAVTLFDPLTPNDRWRTGLDAQCGRSPTEVPDNSPSESPDKPPNEMPPSHEPEDPVISPPEYEPSPSPEVPIVEPPSDLVARETALRANLQNSQPIIGDLVPPDLFPIVMSPTKRNGQEDKGQVRFDDLTDPQLDGKMGHRAGQTDHFGVIAHHIHRTRRDLRIAHTTC